MPSLAAVPARALANLATVPPRLGVALLEQDDVTALERQQVPVAHIVVHDRNGRLGHCLQVGH